MLSEEQVRRLRLRANRLDRPARAAGVDGVLAVVQGICGVQAQVWRGAALAVRARSADTRSDDVDAARVEERCVVRGWYMRGTLQLVAAEDAGWILSALGPPTIAASARRYRQLGLDDDALDRGVDEIERAVSEEGPLTRDTLARRLLDAGLRIDPDGQETYHLVRRGALQGRLCFGPDVDGQETWVATADWLDVPPATLEPDAALRELALRYLRAYQPAAVEDFASWSGLSLSTARRAFSRLDGLEQLDVGGARLAVLGGERPDEASEGGVLRLLGEFDPYLLGYRSRAFAVDERFAKRVHPGGGMLRPAVIRDGVAVATWKHPPRSRTVTVQPFPGVGGFDDDERHARLVAEVADVGRFLGTSPRLVLEEG